MGKVVGYDNHCDHYQSADLQTVDTGIDVDRMETKYICRSTQNRNKMEMHICWKSNM